MGSYTNFSINGYSIFEDKNSVSSDILALFTEEMRIDNIEEEQHVIKYVTKSSVFAKRLSIMGYTYDSVIDDFNNTFDYDGYFELYDNDDVPQEVDFDFFREILSTLVLKGVEPWDLYDNLVPLIELGIDGDDYLYNYVFENAAEYMEYPFGIPLSDPINLLVMILDLFEYKGEVVYDIGQVVENGWVEDCLFAEVAKLRKLQSHYTYGSIIVITEGNSDKIVLEKALRYLYPELSDLYTFFDFKSSKAQGSTSEVIRIAKSFKASKIINKTVILLDNDTAGLEALEVLNGIGLPSNIRVMIYPYLDSCRSYPAIGPNGIETMDINGLACSIEMYLGSTILQLEGRRIPIQWKGYSEKMQQYQGTITKKGYVQDKFHELYRDNPSDIDWDDLKKILDCVIDAFS